MDISETVVSSEKEPHSSIPFVEISYVVFHFPSNHLCAAEAVTLHRSLRHTCTPSFFPFTGALV